MRRPLSLRSRRDFLRVFAEGTRKHRGGLTVIVARRRPAGAPSRLGMSVRTGTGSAVERNRIRRRVRAAFGETAPPGYDVVVRADPSVAQVGYQELVNSMKDALIRAIQG